MPQSRASPLSGLAVVGIVLAVIVSLNIAHTVPRFELPALNYATVLVLTLAIPASLLWLAFTGLTGIWRWLVTALAVLVALPVLFFSLIIATYIFDIVRSGVDSSFEPIAELGSPPISYNLYRTNGGATTSFGIVLRKEWALLPGFKVVTNVHSFYPAYDAAFERINTHRVRVHVQPYGPSGRDELFEFIQ
jgi:hypothetical protein